MNIHSFSTLHISGGAGSGGGALGRVPDWLNWVLPSGSVYTAPADGFFYFYPTTSFGSYDFSIDSTKFSYNQDSGMFYRALVYAFPVAKGNVITINSQMGAAFVPALNRGFGVPKTSSAVRISSGTSYTAPADGFFSLSIVTAPTSRFFYVSGFQLGTANVSFSSCVFVNKGAVLSSNVAFKASDVSSTDFERVFFVPCV